MAIEPTGYAAAWRQMAARKARETPQQPPPWLQAALARPQKPPAWISAPPAPDRVDPVRMMAQLHDGIARIEARRDERARRNGARAAAAMKLYEDTRRQNHGETSEGPSVMVAAMLGLDRSYRLEVF